MWIVLSIIALAAVSVVAFLNQPKFGRLPQGDRLARIQRSPNFRDGQFRNRHATPVMASDRNRFSVMADFLFGDKSGLRPDTVLPVVKTDLRHLDRSENVLVWFGHSSYFMQIDGKRFLVDPVFCDASPVSFVNRPFKGPDAFSPADIPDIDYLIISHDHWDHLDYQTVMQLKERIGLVICALGVGEHFEYWRFDLRKIIEMDWQEDAVLADGFSVHCLPARHFSGRGLQSNRTLWASFLLQTPSQTIYMGGDSGYDTHFAEIGNRFPNIDLAILENGQYNTDWRYIHTLPQYLEQEARDLKAKRVFTVHHSKYALARHPWNEPLENEKQLEADSVCVLVPQMGEAVRLP